MQEVKITSADINDEQLKRLYEGAYLTYYMKKIFPFIILAIIAILGSCSQSGNKTKSSSIGADPQMTDSLANDTNGHYMEFKTISNENLWLSVNSNSLKSEQSRRLADAYNAAVVMNSIITDFDLQMRGYDLDDVVKAISCIDVSVVKEPEVMKKLEAYKNEMLYLLSLDPDSVNQEVHNPWKAQDDLYEYLSKKFHVNTFGKFNEDKYRDEYYNCPSVPEWKELRDKRGNDDLVRVLKNKYSQAKDFDARCIYAIELGHAYEADLDTWEDGDYQNPAIPIMEALMNEKKYSLYLNELWQKWRVLYQSSKGASKDSEIPNWIYNDYRNVCCSTILSYIEGHPDDIMAINEFLVMACKENILRYGVFEYGNQYVVEKYYLFSKKVEV